MRRARAPQRARHIARYLARYVTQCSLEQIGQETGGVHAVWMIATRPRAA
jgi:chromosomal replication initiation ATPase DnaA